LEKKTQILSEAQFEQMVRDLSGDQSFTLGLRRAGLLDKIEQTPMQVVGSDLNELWTERYKPRQVYDLVGNKAVID
jgi:CO dehydrogenase/acetyl-CoA synthase beta subunit